jgi:hypothetical protein
MLVKHKYVCQHREVEIGHCGKEWKQGNCFCSWKYAVGCVKKQLPAWVVLHYSMISFVIFFCSPPQYWSLLTLLSMHLLVFYMYLVGSSLNHRSWSWWQGLASMCILAICEWVGSFISYHLLLGIFWVSESYSGLWSYSNDIEMWLVLWMSGLLCNTTLEKYCFWNLPVHELIF